MYNLVRELKGVQKDVISIVIPCFNEEETVPVFYQKMTEIMAGTAIVEF